MTSDLTVGRLHPEDEVTLERVDQIQAMAFGVSAEVIRASTALAGIDNLRVVRDGDRAVGCLKLIPMGHWIGGRSVPTVGIAGVAVDPAERGRGVASLLMAATLRELHGQGVASSSLYPATIPLYRKVGYEQAGTRHRIELPLSAIAGHVRQPALREATVSDFAAMEACYERFARTQVGLLDRGHYIWSRARLPMGETGRHYIVEDGDEVRAYLTMAQHSKGGLGYDLVLSDVVVETAAAGRRLLSFLAGHDSMAESVVFHGEPRHPLLAVAGHRHARMTVDFLWMFRVVNLPAALMARGWPKGCSGSLHLRVSDDVLPANEDDWLVEVADGEARVQRGGEGRLALDVRGLAVLMTGFRPCASLRALGQLDGPSDDLALADALFAGPDPWMPDMF